MRKLLKVSKFSQLMPASRSLNLANAVGIVVYEAWRQAGFPGAAPHRQPESAAH